MNKPAAISTLGMYESKVGEFVGEVRMRIRTLQKRKFEVFDNIQLSI